MTIFESMSVVGLFLGPIVGVLLTIYLQNRSADRERKQYVFRTLMKNRQSWLEPDHVFALNLIEVEFHEHKDVIDALKAFLHSLDDNQRQPDEIILQEHNETEAQLRNRAFFDRLSKKRNKLYIAMLSRMAKILKYNIDQLELLDSGYWPKAFGDIQESQRIARQFVQDLYEGRRVLPVYVANTAPPADETKAIS